jgi:lipopolysaccharide/colanic/teichoic acid biosynthesis glycosyltransferase
LVRRSADVVVASLLLLLLAPVILLVGLAIRLESGGPIFYRQRRIGRDKAPFVIAKFRSMRAGATAAPHREYVSALINADTPDYTYVGRTGLYKLAVDDRITRVGRFIRRWSIDELPQLWNVVRGDMSLVGPRPVIPYEVDHYPHHWHNRFAVKPGLTGLWQVSGRNEHSYDEMVRFDIEYAERQSLWLDLLILLKTPWVVVSRRGVA